MRYLEQENTLWAFATIGTKPGERMMRQLQWRTEVISGEFNSQKVANTLWAFATMGTDNEDKSGGTGDRGVITPRKQVRRAFSQRSEPRPAIEANTAPRSRVRRALTQHPY